MSDIAKRILIEMNQPLHERLNQEFIGYLIEFDQDNLIDLAKNINWEPVAKMFGAEYTKLWNKLAVPKIEKESKVLEKEFARVVLANIKPKLFHLTYRYLKGQITVKNINDENIDTLMNEAFSFGMYELFRVFDYQFTLSSLSKNNDPKVMIRKIEDLRKRAEPENKLSDKKKVAEEERVFKMIDEELIKNEKLGKKWSVRAVCELFAKNELGIGIDKNHIRELDNFYMKYQTHRKKSSLDTK
jgi:hypothetical protein